MTVSDRRYAETIETARVAFEEKSGDWMMRQFVAARDALVSHGVSATIVADVSRQNMRLELTTKGGERVVVADGAMSPRNTGILVPRENSCNAVPVSCERDVLDGMCATLLGMGEYLS